MRYDSIEVLHGVKLAVDPEQTLALLGPNGSGKSTTIKVATGQMQWSRGEVRLSGKSIKRADARSLALSGISRFPNDTQSFLALLLLRISRSEASMVNLHP